MRVLLVSRSLPCHVRGGLEFHVADLATGLARAGLEIELLTTPTTADYERDMAGRGVKLRRLEAASARYTLRYLRTVGPAIDRLCADRPYDVIHGQEFALGFWNPGIARAAQTVLSIHGTITSETPLHRDVFSTLSLSRKIKALGRYGRRYLFAPSWRRWLRQAGRLLVDSDFTAGELNSIDPGLAAKVRKVPLGLDLDQYPALDRNSARTSLGWDTQSGPTLLTIGRLEWQKGQDLALRALAELRDRPWRYVVAGEGSAGKELRRLAERLGLGDRVEMAGRVDDRTRSLMLAGADLFLWPERTHPAFGLVGLESMMMGTPVLASRRGAIPELIDETNGGLFDPCDAASLASALRMILDDTQRLGALALGLRRRTLDRFDPEAMVEGTIAVYQELVP